MIESILALPRHPLTADILILLYEDYSLLEDGVLNICGCILFDASGRGEMGRECGWQTVRRLQIHLT